MSRLETLQVIKSREVRIMRKERKENVVGNKEKYECTETQTKKK
jgi:hypothetical protein